MLGRVTLKGVEAGEWSLAFTTAAQLAYEEQFDEPFMKVAERFAPGKVEELRMSFVVELVAIGLKPDHPEITRVDACEVIDAIGGVEVAMKAIGDALIKAFPSAAATPEGAGAKSGNGRKGKGQTGPS